MTEITQQERDIIKKGLLVACEFGFKCHEKGYNLEMTLIQLKEFCREFFKNE